MESLALSANPDFIGLIERALARYKATGGVSLEEMRRRWAVPEPKRRPKTGPRATSRRGTTAKRPSRRSTSR